MCPYGTFAYRQMLFDLCNTSATFKLLNDVNLFRHGGAEVFMDDFSL